MGLFGELLNVLKKRKLYRKLTNKFPTLKVEEGLVIKGPLENLSIGNHTQIQSNVMFHLGGMEWCLNQGSLVIGEKGLISPNCVFYAAGPGGIQIGNNFDCAPGVKIFSSSSNYNYREEKIFLPVNIGNDVILYSNVVVSPGVTIGDGAVVLASSVVTVDVPPYTVYGGVPASFIKDLSKK